MEKTESLHKRVKDNFLCKIWPHWVWLEEILALLIFIGIFVDTLGLSRNLNFINQLLWRWILTAESFVSKIQELFSTKDGYISLEAMTAVFGGIGITDFSIALSLELHSEKYSGILMSDVLQYFFPDHFIGQFIMHPAFALMGIYSSQMGWLYYTGLCAIGMSLSVIYSFMLSLCLIHRPKSKNSFIALYMEKTMLSGEFSTKKTENLFRYIAYLRQAWETNRPFRSFQTNELRQEDKESQTARADFHAPSEEAMLLRYASRWITDRLKYTRKCVVERKKEIADGEQVLGTITRILEKCESDIYWKTADIGSYCLDIIVGSSQQQEEIKQTDEEQAKFLLALYRRLPGFDSDQTIPKNHGLQYNQPCHILFKHMLVCGDLWKALLGENFFEPWQVALAYQILMEAAQSGTGCDLIVFGLVNYLNLIAPELYDYNNEDVEMDSYLKLRKAFLEQVYHTYSLYADQDPKLNQHVQNKFKQLWFQIMYLAAAEVQWCDKTDMHPNHACKDFTDFCLQVCNSLPANVKMEVSHQHATIGAAFIEFCYICKEDTPTKKQLNHINLYTYLSLIHSIENDLTITDNPSK